ncbi:MAG TPA: M24 family metallopeptidase [Terriglobales bacterium]|nr:M24 family metallopeptidase [Terriglobales bacterium]
MPSQQEIVRRYQNIRKAMQAENVDALIVCGNQYAGFEGAVRYVSGFEIVHRYCYVLIPMEGELTLIFPAEARWIGDKSKPWVRDHVWPAVPGQWIAERAKERKWKRLGVYGLKHVMAVIDYQALVAAGLELVDFDFAFDMARAVKSEEEMKEIREAMDIVVEGFYALVKSYAPGKTEAEIMAPAVEVYFARGAGPRMMNIVLSGTHGTAEASFKVPGHRVVNPDDLMLYSLEVTNSEGYWVEFSRAIIQGKLDPITERMKQAYPIAMEEARKRLREGELASGVHRAITDVFQEYGFSLGHLSGHGIGATMLEYPAVGSSSDVVLKENMVLSVHPQVVDQDGKVCLYTQDTYRVGKTEGENLTNVPWRLYRGGDV